jgi:hypothetical protein
LETVFYRRANKLQGARDLRVSVTGRGGWRGSPNSLAALDRYRVHFPDQPKCSRCRRIALRGTPFCSAHSGRKPAPRTPGRRAASLLAGMERAGLLPRELIALPVWRELSNVMGEARTLTRLALVLAWDKRLSEPLAWAPVWRDATRLARETPPRLSPLPAFMDNQ